MSIVASAPQGYADLSWQDLLNYGATKWIDSEFANPAPPVPYGGPTQAETQVMTTPTGSGTTSKATGAQPGIMANNNMMLYGGIAAAVLIGGIVLVKAL